MDLNFIKNYVESSLERDINLNTRKRDFVYARALYMVLAKENTKKSYAEIGRFIGKDHATVLHGVKKVFEEALENDEHVAASYSAFNLGVVGAVSADDQPEPTYEDHIGVVDGLKTTNEQLATINIDLVNTVKNMRHAADKGTGKFEGLIISLTEEGQEILFTKMQAVVAMMKTYKIA